jgi:hypothetical protein
MKQGKLLDTFEEDLYHDDDYDEARCSASLP